MLLAGPLEHLALLLLGIVQFRARKMTLQFNKYVTLLLLIPPTNKNKPGLITNYDFLLVFEIGMCKKYIYITTLAHWAKVVRFAGQSYKDFKDQYFQA